MAIAAGQPEAPNLKMSADFTGSTQSAYFIVRNSIMPQEYQTDNRTGLLYPLKITRQVNIAASQTLSEYWRVGEIAKQALANVPSNKTGAYAGELSDNQINYPTGNSMIKNSGQYDQVRYVIVKWDFTASHATNTCDIYHVYFQGRADTDYSGTGVELLKRETAAQRLYKDDMPCSAWHVMYGLIESHEKILSENKPALSLPVFGTAGVAIP